MMSCTKFRYERSLIVLQEERDVLFVEYSVHCWSYYSFLMSSRYRANCYLIFGRHACMHFLKRANVAILGSWE
jgi:hypothetical protein